MILRNVIIAADEVIIPMTAGRYSMQGIASLSDTINDAKELNDDLKVAGILLVDNEHTNLNNDTKEGIAQIAQQLGTKAFDSVVRHTVKVKEAQTHRMPLIKYARSCTAERDYEDFVEEYLGV